MNKYICKDCLENNFNLKINEIPFNDYNEYSNINSFSCDKCNECGGSNLIKVYNVGSTYVRGYGYKDIKGAKNDMDLHLMTNNSDPYGKSRKPGEKRDVIERLKKNQMINKNPKKMY